MKKIVARDREQLKCNFCTYWFSVDTQFAALQRYSLNSCLKCFEQFHHRVVHSQTMEIYEIAFIKTGIFLKPNNGISQIQGTLQQMAENERTEPEIKDYLLKREDLSFEIEAEVRPLKEELSQTCKKMFSGFVENWNQVMESLNVLTRELQKNYYKNLDELRKIGPNISQQANDIMKMNVKQFEKFRKNFKNQITKKPPIQKMKNSILELLTQNQCQKNKIKNVNMTESVYENGLTQSSTYGLGNGHDKSASNLLSSVKSKNNLKDIRNKIILEKEKSCNNEGSARAASIECKGKENYESINLLQKSKRKYSFIDTGSSTFRKQNSQKSLNFSNQPKTPRSFKCEQDNVSEASHASYFLDDYRGIIMKNLKQKNSFKSFLEGGESEKCPEKEEIRTNPHKTYGEKAMVEKLVELKVETNINENSCELINSNIASINENISCFLRSLQWSETIVLLKLVKVSLYDNQLDQLLHWLSEKKEIESIVLTNNVLTEVSVHGILEFCRRNLNGSDNDHRLKDIYLGNNFIKVSRVKKIVCEIKDKYGINLHF